MSGQPTYQDPLLYKVIKYHPSFHITERPFTCQGIYSGFCLSARATDITTTESDKEMAPSSYNLGVISVISASGSKVLNKGERDFNFFV